MKRIISVCLLSLFVLSLAGCPSKPQDAVSDADQSAIEAYQAAEEASQKAMEDQMEGTK
jgi:hypothetical protein